LILDYYFYGVLTFIIVQQLDGIRLSLTKYRGNECKKRNEEEWKKKESLSEFLVKDFLILLGFQSVITLVICFALKLLGVQLEGLLIATAFYFLSILTNTFRGVKAALKNRQDKSLVLFAFGISLFLLCDINVGFFNMSGFLAIPEAIYNVLYSLSSLLMWTFYAPAQVLIALSVTESGLDI
jgi:cation transport ATPase